MYSKFNEALFEIKDSGNNDTEQSDPRAVSAQILVLFWSKCRSGMSTVPTSACSTIKCLLYDHMLSLDPYEKTIVITVAAHTIWF